MTLNRRDQILKSLENREYRHIFAAEHLDTGLAFQLRHLREDRGWTQEELARRAAKPQEMISRWENPDYGKMTISTLKALAEAFDVALIVKFAPFGELADWIADLTPGRLAPPDYEKERAWIIPTASSEHFEWPGRELFVRHFGTADALFGSIANWNIRIAAATASATVTTSVAASRLAGEKELALVA